MKAYNKLFCITIILMIFMITLVSSAPPQENSNGYNIRSAFPDYLRQNEDFDAHAHVFLISDGTYITDATCYLHLYNVDGTHLYEGEDSTVSHDWDYSWDLDAGNFSTIGTHTYIIQCNGSVGVDDFGGFISGEYYVNGYGEAVSEGISLNFNFAMIFLMILFVLAFVGVIVVPAPVGKWACYFISHILFIVGTFSVWQFNNGFTTSFGLISGVFKVLFYVSTFALFPMVLIAIVWMVYYHTMNDTIKGFLDRGFDPDDAYRRAMKNKW